VFKTSLSQYRATSSICPAKKLRLVARALVDNAIDGDTTAVRECFDRMDGKVTQGADATDQVRGNITFTWNAD
jgi:hypothetical protein